MTISGVRLELDQDQVESVERIVSPVELYKQRRSELDDDDESGRYQLAYELYESGAYDLALRELRTMARDFPENLRVELLRDVILERIEQIREAEEGPQADRPSPQPDPDRPTPPQRDGRPSGPGGPAQALGEDFPLLDQEQINRIRVYEIDLANDPNVRVPPKVLNELFERYGDHPEVPKGFREQRNLRGAPGFEKLRLMFAVRARELYGEVSVPQDPPALADFRRTIHRQYVLNYCATAACHGGERGGEFILYPRRGTSTETVYTNFYILDQYQRGGQRMIDRGEPASSLLVQYGLPRESAEYPHPDVEGWRPRFRPEFQRDPFYQSLLDWIGELYNPRPNYGLDFQIPKGEPLPSESKSEDDDATGGTGTSGGGS